MEEKRVFNKDGYDRREFDKKGIHKNGTHYDYNGFDINGYDRDGYDKRGYDKDGYDRDGYMILGYNRDGYDRDGYDERGYDRDGYDERGYDKEGYDRNGYSYLGFNKKRIHKNGTRYDDDGYDFRGLDKDGYDRDGYNRYGYNNRGFNKKGVHRNGTIYDEKGFRRGGKHKNGTRYDDDGYDFRGLDKDGFNRDGVNKNGLNRHQIREEKNQRRANYLGLINKAEKLGKGEMSLEDYVKSSKTSIEELIEFAKKEKMSADVIRGLHKYKKLYAVYKKPFSKKQYLEGTILLINGQEVRPTETDVDKCIEFLKANDSLICDKTVKDTVRKYLRGEIDVTIKDEELQEQSEEDKTNIIENKYTIKQNLVEVLVGQQKKIKAQETEITDLKSQNKGEV